MNGERIFRALYEARETVVGLGLSWTKADSSLALGAITTGNYKMLPRKVRDLLEKVAKNLYSGEL